jgi:hemerythrin-like metal-binding protein
MMNGIYDLNHQGASKSALAEALDKLKAYTQFHFGEEERFMELMNYDDTERHKIIHAHLLAELKNHINKFKDSHFSLGKDFFYFLRYWLSTHIQHIDRKYGEASLPLDTAC